jgi:CheY-like chemotaxis protein
LEIEGFQTDVALDGEAGLRLFEEQEPSLVVLDLNLPKLPGKELFKTLRGLRPSVPVIMLTSSSDEGMPVQVGGHDEIGELAEAFNRMAAEIDRRNRANKEFMSVTVHELKTPITAIRGAAEIMVREAGRRNRSHQGPRQRHGNTRGESSQGL